MTTAPRRRIRETEPESAPPPSGHNRPAPMTPAEVAVWLQDSTRDLETRRAEILAGIDRFLAKYAAIPDDDVQGRASDFAGGQGAIAAWLKQTEGRRVSEKEPFLAGGRTVDAFFKSMADRVIEGQKQIRARMTAYAVKKEAEERERARKEAEAAAQRAREAEAEALRTMQAESLERAAQVAREAEHAQAIAEAKPAEFTRVHGSATVSSLRSTWKFCEAESNLMTLAKAVVEGRAPVAYLAFASTRIGYAIRSEGVRQIPGCVIKEERSI